MILSLLFLRCLSVFYIFLWISYFFTIFYIFFICFHHQTCGQSQRPPNSLSFPGRIFTYIYIYIYSLYIYIYDIYKLIAHWQFLIENFGGLSDSPRPCVCLFVTGCAAWNLWGESFRFFAWNLPIMVQQKPQFQIFQKSNMAAVMAIIIDNLQLKYNIIS